MIHLSERDKKKLIDKGIIQAFINTRTGQVYYNDEVCELISKCNHKRVRIQDRKFKNGTMHKEKICLDCFKHLGFVSKKQSATSLINIIN